MAQQPSIFKSVEIDQIKLTAYCLSDTHPRGRHKARVFRARLGLTAADANFLAQTLSSAATSEPERLLAGSFDNFGRRYNLDVTVRTSVGAAVVRSAWIVRPGETVLRFVTCYVL